MNREIKYRAWDKKSKKMRAVNSIAFNYDKESFSTGRDCLPKVINLWGRDIIEDKYVIVQREPKEVVLMQYTGLKDKDNQEMYEGDLVEDLSYHDSIVCELRFENTGFWLKGNNDNVLFMPSQQYRKVVGNIHDNPVKEG